MRRRLSGKTILWVVLALPAAITATRFGAAPGTPLDDLLHPTGEWSARLMILALMFTPLSLLLPGNGAIRWLVAHRRSFGVGAFCYALAHLMIYLVDKETIGRVLGQIGELGIWTGWAAFLLMVPLATTSNEFAVRALGTGWKLLQRLAYPAALLTLLHWMFVHEGLVSGLVNFAPLILLQLCRIVLLVRRGASRGPQRSF